MAEELTPMQRQYRAIKRELPPGAILMFRLGDFYEMFGEDAIVASPILGATLTQRGGAPLCGIPYHALDAYLAKLIRAGKTAAICDQMEDPRLVKKGQVVRREVTRIVTPGTITEDGLLDADANCYIAAVAGLGLALLDLSTGEFAVEPFDSAEKLADALARYRPAELVLPKPDDEDRGPCSVVRDSCSTSHEPRATNHDGLEGKNDLVCAGGALLHYVHVTLRHAVDHVRSIRLRESADFLALDAGTIRHLALLPGDGVSREASLLGVLNVTRTPMGARRLAAWIRQPLRSADAVNARLDAVETFVKDRIALSSLRERLGGVRDLERLIAKVDSGRANARDLRALAASLRPVADVKGELDGGRQTADGGRSVHDHDRGLDHLEGAQGTAGEIVGSRGIDEVDLAAAEFGVQRSRIDGLLVGLLEFGVVGDGVLVFDAAATVNHLSFVEHSLGEGGLTTAGSTDQDDVADVFC